MAWSPDAQQLQRLGELLKESVSGSTGDHERTRARLSLDQLGIQPELPLYLATLLGQPTLGDFTTRATAGLWLKTLLGKNWHIYRATTAVQLREMLLPSLGDPDRHVRNAASIAVTTLLSLCGLSGWPELPSILLRLVTEGGPSQEGAINALANICEDSAPELDRDGNIMGELIPKLLHMCSSERPARVRAKAIFCVTQFVPVGSAAFYAYVDEYLQRLFMLAHDPDGSVLQEICRAFTALLTVRPDKLAPHLDGVVQFCLHCLNNESAAFDAGEFLLGFVESEDVHDVISPLIPSMVPPLLNCMAYSEDDQFAIEALAQNDEDQADRDEDIRPTVASHHRRLGKAEEEEAELEDALAEWNLRKVAASSIDRLATDWAPQVVPVALPVLLSRISDSQEWPIRESAILAFGAIAMGCIESGETEFVPELVQYLTRLAQDENAPIREMSCWALGRYADCLIVEPELFGPAFQGILACSLDHNKKCQEAGITAIAVIAEVAGESLVPYTEPLLSHIQQCFAKYQVKNRLTLYESLSSICGAVGPRLSDPAVLPLLIDPLVARWQAVSNDDFEMLALMECLGAVAVVTGAAFTPYASPIFERCFIVIRDTLVDTERYTMDPTSVVDEPESGRATCALDLVDGLVQALPANILSPLISACQSPTFTELLQASLGENAAPDIRQSALAVIGDLAIFAMDELAPALPLLVPAILANITGGEEVERGGLLEGVCSNAMWATGEIALHTPQGVLEPWFNDLFQRLGTNLVASGAFRSPGVLENAANSIGRLGLNVPNLVAPHLSMLLDSWLQVELTLEETLEKDTAVQGIFVALAANPGALSGEQQLLVLLKMLAQIFQPTAELQSLVAKVLGGYRQYLSDFDAVVSQLPGHYQQQLQKVYKL